MNFTITILGSNAALPTKDTITSAQVMNVHDKLYLMDCGEGMQAKLELFGIKRNKIEAVFISHLHGDHILGLPGLLTSYAHFQRHKQLTIVGPKGIKELIQTFLRLSQAFISFEISFIELDNGASGVIYEDNTIKVTSFPLKHRIVTYGYRFTEKIQNLNINTEAISAYNLSFDEMIKLKKGLDLTIGHEIIPNKNLTYFKTTPRSYAYCSDTIFDESIIEYIEGVDLLYHESTYLHEMMFKAGERMHSTSIQAATIAKIANVGALILGHFSTRYIDKTPFKTEAEKIFGNVHLAFEGLEYKISEKKIF